MTDEFFARLPKPRIPQFDEVHHKALQLGGTKEMAEAFFNKWDAVGWYKINPTQPIMNFVPLLSMFIQNWRNNESSRKPNKPGAASWGI